MLQYYLCIVIKTMRNEAKVHPVLDSCKLVSGTNIRIYNMDDDMHGKRGIYKLSLIHI